MTLKLSKTVFENIFLNSQSNFIILEVPLFSFKQVVDNTFNLLLLITQQ